MPYPTNHLITSRILCPITATRSCSGFRAQFGHVIDHRDGGFELSLCVIPTDGTDLAFVVPHASGITASHYRILAIIESGGEELRVEIGAIDIRGSDARVVFFGHTEFAARFVFYTDTARTAESEEDTVLADCLTSANNPRALT